MNIACSQYKAQYEIVSVTCCVCYIINFDLFEGLPHASDSIQVLNQDNLKQENRIYFRFSPLCLRIQAFDFLINKVKVYCSIYFLNK